MNVITKFIELGASPFYGESCQVDNSKYKKFLSKDHIHILKQYNNYSVSFEKGAIFIIDGDRYPPICDTDRSISLDLLYGLKNDENSIAERNNHLTKVYPELDDYIFIGESSGGDQICLKKKTGEIYYFYHEAEYEYEELYFLTSNFSIFVERLLIESEDKNSDPLKGVISYHFDF